MKIKFIILPFIIFITSLITRPAWAASELSESIPQTLRVSPLIIPIELSPGKTIKQTITLENLTANPIPIQATIEGFDASDEEGGYSFESTEAASPLITWSQVSPSDFIIDAQSKRQVELTIQTPSVIPPGGYYALAFFTALNRIDKARSPVVIPKIGVLMLGSLGIEEDLTADQKAQIVTFKSDKFIYEKSPINLILRTKNSSMNWFTVKPFLSINRIFPKKLFDEEIPEKVILPGKIRRWNHTFDTNLSPNIYKANMAVSIGKGEFVTKTIYFVVFPAKNGAILLISVIVLGYLFMKRRNISKALKVLLKG
ncbi:hypothetical protein ACFL1A_01695 [Patescibacteria group bacterium]